MKENYLAWKVDPRTFDAQWSLRDQMLFLVRFAVLAPSSHNSQPWKFSIKDSTLRLEADRARALPKSDANYRQLFISLGCALKNCLIAADYAGFGATVVYGGEGLDTYAELTLEKKSDHERDPAHLIFAIPRRHTNRNKYATRLPDQAFLTHMSTRVDGETQLFFVDESPEKESLADVVAESNIAIMDDVHFREELSGYVKSNVTSSGVGMPMFGFGMPTPPSFLASFVLKRFNMNKLSKKEDALLLKKFTPLFGVICTKGDHPESWIKAGALYEAIALAAEQEGINTAPMAAVVQFADFHKQLQKILHTDLRPQVFFRMGYADTLTPHSPRLADEEVVADEDPVCF